MNRPKPRYSCGDNIPGNTKYTHQFFFHLHTWQMYISMKRSVCILEDFQYISMQIIINAYHKSRNVLSERGKEYIESEYHEGERESGMKKQPTRVCLQQVMGKP